MNDWTTKQVIGAVAGALGILLCILLFSSAVSDLPAEDQQLIKYQMMGVRPIVIINQNGGSSHDRGNLPHVQGVERQRT